ncbi:sorbosone dehydrogenase family protein [Amycolatopsis sp. FDAARGOS 1241]|uniref:PQQ-dependent sugar dehydrogenase n=1 Tax=Amycolatopsis sp. FDAARGOS 1241 TaxID=2778070 RepID=UPI00194F4797|nr:PQQ-dependent sugar dehydrogenase [Amycolatopsis sp. FDAARGOS 1241]QRP47027.1 PQQ-dependent sugar dehydrogenase [Amycolatopsis sp. FDAARGOS 1241]
MRKPGVVLLAVVAAFAAGCSGAASSSPPLTSAPSSAATGGFRVETVAGGLEHGWDIGFLPDGSLLVPQRPGKLALIRAGRTTEVRADFSDVLVQGEGGLMGLVLAADFATSREFTTCQTHQEADRAVDVRLVTWRLAADSSSATKVRDLLTGLPVNPSGRHSGCRPTLAPDGALLVGTGDTARPTIAQDRRSLGGKVLRINAKTGEPLPDNPFFSSADPNERRIYTYGHRNIQGVAIRPGTGQVLTSEHGPTFDDEVNLIRPGGNYGWDPSKGGTDSSYDESVPMTDTTRFPNAVRPLWTSGNITEATSGDAFLTGKQWGPNDGALAVVALKGQKLLLLHLDAAAHVTHVTLPPEFNEHFGRLRAVRSAPDGSLYVTTSNGSDDKLLRVTPA